VDDVLMVPRCDCRIFAATGLPCRDCPKRRAAPSCAGRALSNAPGMVSLFRYAMGGHGKANMDRLRRQSPPAPGRCCED
jgi:hypothetical protein